MLFSCHGFVAVEYWSSVLCYKIKACIFLSYLYSWCIPVLPYLSPARCPLLTPLQACCGCATCLLCQDANEVMYRNSGSYSIPMAPLPAGAKVSPSPA